MNKENILEIYTDESTSYRKRLKSICAVSGLCQDLNELRENLKSKLGSENISSELKFSKVTRDNRKIACAKDFISLTVDYASKSRIRIDVIIWDLQDGRHSVQGRDDKENLERMYFHLLRNIVEQWKVFYGIFCPDEHSEYDYQKIIEYLNNTQFPRKEPYIFKLFEEDKIKLNFIDVKPQKSEEQPLIQLADLFAGIACFSKENSDEFKNYKKQKEKEIQESLFMGAFDETETELRKSILNRFQIIEWIKESCEGKGLKVSLNSNGYLKTYDPRISINFWHYEPQGDYDKAPQSIIKQNRF